MSRKPTAKEIGSLLSSIGALAMSAVCALAAMNAGEPSARPGMILVYYPALLGIQIFCGIVALWMLPEVLPRRRTFARAGVLVVSASMILSLVLYSAIR